MLLNHKKTASFLSLVIGLCLVMQAGYAQFKVIGYYPTYAGGYPGSINAVDLAKVTHVYIAFANPDGAGNLVPDFGTNANITTVVNAVHGQGKKVFLSIAGGAATGGNYQTHLSSPANITAFVAKIVAYANTYNLDGIDVDIEGNILNGATLTAAQYENFVTALGAALHANGKLMSCAIGTWFGNYVTSAAANQFDWINMMSYDLYGPWTGAGQHAPYSMTTSDFQYWNVNKGVPASKLIVGLPFYGYGWGSLANNGITYCNIVNTYPGAQNADQVGSGGNVITYNGIATIKQKTTYAQANAGGVMIWELTQDCATSDSRSLLLAVSQVLAPLPVTWVDFHATHKADGILLHWSTAQEKSNAYFSVESSTDGMVFQEISKEPAAGNSVSLQEYMYLDTQPLSENVYYRIKQVDADGQYNYTSIIFVHANLATPVLFEVHPNPAVDGEFHVRLQSYDVQSLQLLNLLGESYYSEVLAGLQTSEMITISTTDIPYGIYVLTAVAKGKSYSTKVIIQ